MTHSDQPYMTPTTFSNRTSAPAEPAAPETRPGRRSKKAAPTRSGVNRNFIVAIIFALLAALVVYSLTAGSKPVNDYVVVAGSAVPAGSTLDAGLLKAVRMDPAVVQPGAVTGKNAQKAIDEAVAKAAGQRSQYPLTENQQVIPDQFVQPIANLGQPLGADERLVSFQATVSSAVAGTLKAGDLVDMYATDSNVAGLLVPSVQIVSVTVSESQYASVASAQSTDKTLTPSEALPGTPVPGTYVARVNTADVAKIVAADADGKIYLAYRSGKDAQSDTTPESVLSVLCADPGDVQLLECKSYLAGGAAAGDAAGDASPEAAQK